MTEKPKNNTLNEWTEQLQFHLDKLREGIDMAKDFSFQDNLKNHWDNVKALPPAIKDGRAKRCPVPVNLLDSVAPLDFGPHIRSVGGQALPLDFGDKTLNVLTLSSGGAKGAYGAGLLTGWAERGDMPDFDLMMGVSTGALLALLAFTENFDALHYFYNEVDSEDLANKNMLQGITVGASLYDNSQFVARLKDYIDAVMVKQLAEQRKKGRTLLVGTTNLDRGLPVMWDLTAIADSGNPLAQQLIAEVVVASCAIPVIFPPVQIAVGDEKGNEYDELHVDGAASLQLLIHLPPNKANVYAIVNKQFVHRYRPANIEVFDIATKSLDAALANGMLGDIYRLYVNTTRRGNAFHATWIPEDFSVKPASMFDRVYMQQLFALGKQMIADDSAWGDVPPFF